MQNKTPKKPLTLAFNARLYGKDTPAAVAGQLRDNGRWQLLATNDGPFRPLVVAWYDPATGRLSLEPRCPRWAEQGFQAFVAEYLSIKVVA